MKSVFISYSWDNEEHSEWVANLANTLRSVYGVNAKIDNFLQIGNLQKMMVQEISNNDKVMLVLTENYTKKADSFDGGVGYETTLLLNYVTSNPNKIIVVMKEKCNKPFYLGDFYHIDFTSADKYTESLESLVLKLNDQPVIEMMPINTTNPKKVSPKKGEVLGVTKKEITSAKKIDNVEKVLSITNYAFNDIGRIRCETWINEYGYEIVMESAKTAILQYLVKGNDGEYTKTSSNEVFAKLGGICKNKFEEKTKPYIAATNHFISYCKKSFYVSNSNFVNLKRLIGDILYDAFSHNNHQAVYDKLMLIVRSIKNQYEAVEQIERIHNDIFN